MKIRGILETGRTCGQSGVGYFPDWPRYRHLDDVACEKGWRKAGRARPE
jgi:hypothetical protein